MSSKYENEEFNLVNDLTDTNSILNEIKKSKEGSKWVQFRNYINFLFLFFLE